jgi:hypothetical protein
MSPQWDHPETIHQSRLIRFQRLPRGRIAVPRFLRENMMADHLAAYVDDDADALVFTAPEGGALRHANFRNRVWLPALTAAGLLENLRAPGERPLH